MSKENKNSKRPTALLVALLDWAALAQEHKEECHDQKETLDELMIGWLESDFSNNGHDRSTVYSDVMFLKQGLKIAQKFKPKYIAQLKEQLKQQGNVLS